MSVGCVKDVLFHVDTASGSQCTDSWHAGFYLFDNVVAGVLLMGAAVVDTLVHTSSHSPVIVCSRESDEEWKRWGVRRLAPPGTTFFPNSSMRVMSAGPNTASLRRRNLFEEGMIVSTECDGTESDGTESDGTESDGTESGGTESDGTESDGTESGGTESDGTESDGTESDGTESDGTESDGTESDGTESDGTESDGTESDGTESDGTESDGTESDGTESDGTESDGTESDGSESGGR
eukprot:gene12358-15539_t